MLLPVLCMSNCPVDGQSVARVDAIIQAIGPQLRVSAPLAVRRDLVARWPSLTPLRRSDIRNARAVWSFGLEQYLVTWPVVTSLLDRHGWPGEAVEFCAPGDYRSWPYNIGTVHEVTGRAARFPSVLSWRDPQIELDRPESPVRRQEMSAAEIKQLQLRMYEISPLPYYVQLDIASACNLRCSMCYFHGEGGKSGPLYVQKGGFLDSEAFLKILAEMRAAGSSHPVGPIQMLASVRGEVLLHPQAKDWIRMIREAQVELVLITNGMLLDDVAARLMVDLRVRHVTISLDSMTEEVGELIRVGYDQSQVETNIERLIQLRADSGGSLPAIALSFTDVASNQHEIKPFIDRWIDKVDQISIQTKQYFDETLFARRYDRKIIDINESERDICAALLNSIVVLSDGEIHCCSCGDFGSQTLLGHISQMTPAEAYHSARHDEIVNAHLAGDFTTISVCRHCETWKCYRDQEVPSDDGHRTYESTSGITKICNR